MVVKEKIMKSSMRTIGAVSAPKQHRRTVLRVLGGMVEFLC